MAKHQSKIIIILSLVLSAIFVFFAFGRESQPQISSPGPLPIANAQVPKVTSVEAPDGQFTLSMKQEKGKDTTTFTFTMTNESTGAQTEIFTDTLPTGTTLSIPQNAFSSDDKYVFLKQVSSSQTSYFVLTSSGDSISKDAQTLDFSSLFATKEPNYVITDATGWAGPTLVVINTNKVDGSLGPSFWFDVSSKVFIPLSTRFN